jgi:hypothetical protein
LPLSSDYWTLTDFHTQLCTEYFGRQLSFPEDALNAFEGALNAFRESNPESYAGHFWGIPIFSVDETRESRIDSFIDGLNWFAANDDSTRMVKSSSTQNGQALFPSWSWAASKAKQLPNHDYHLFMDRWWEEDMLRKAGDTVVHISHKSKVRKADVRFLIEINGAKTPKVDDQQYGNPIDVFR